MNPPQAGRAYTMCDTMREYATTLSLSDGIKDVATALGDTFAGSIVIKAKKAKAWYLI